VDSLINYFNSLTNLVFEAIGRPLTQGFWVSIIAGVGEVNLTQSLHFRTFQNIPGYSRAFLECRRLEASIPRRKACETDSEEYS
jgi:hypothetical protein